MDQDTGDAETMPSPRGPSPIPPDTPVEQPNTPPADITTATTPQSQDNNVELPVISLRYEEKEVSGSQLFRTEIPDSDAASEFSSPVKLDKRVEMRDMATAVLAMPGLQSPVKNQELQTAEGDVQGDETRMEIPDSEEAAELSSPVKVDLKEGDGEEGQRLGAIEEGKELSGILEDVTMMDVPAAALGDGMVAASRGEDKIDGEGQQVSEAGELQVADTAMEVGDEHHMDIFQNDEMRKDEAAQLSGKIDGGGPPETSPQDAEKQDEVRRSNAPQSIPDSDNEDEDEELPDAPHQLKDTQQPTSNAPSAHEETVPATKLPNTVPEPSDDMSKIAEPDTAPKIPVEEESQEPATLASDETTLSAAKSTPTQSPPVLEKTIEAPAVASQHVIQAAETVLAPSSTKDPSHTVSPQVPAMDGDSSLPITTAQDHLTENGSRTASTSFSAHSSSSLPATKPSFNKKRKDSPSEPVPESKGSPKTVIEASPGQKIKAPGSTSFAAPEGSQNRDVVMEELKAMKIKSIQSRIAALEEQITAQKSKLEEVTKDLTQPAGETVKNHIKLLHDYNDIRDVGQGLIGMIADNRAVRIAELYEEFGVDLKD